MTEGLAVWKQIEQVLSEDIASGVYKPGDRLPTEAQLAKRFGVNRHTLRRAVSALSDGGKVRVEQGRGMYVQENKLNYPVGARVRFTQGVAAAHRLPTREFLRVDVVRPDRAVSENLKIELDEEVVVADSIGVVDGRPVSYASSYFPVVRFHALGPHLWETGSITKSLALLGIHDYTRSVTRISAQLSTAHIARHLKILPGSPVLLTEGTDVDVNNVPISYNVSHFAGDWVQLVVAADDPKFDI